MSEQIYTVKLDPRQNSIISVEVQIGIKDAESNTSEQPCHSGYNPIYSGKRKRAFEDEGNEEEFSDEEDLNEIHFLCDRLNQNFKSRIDDTILNESSRVNIYEEWIDELDKINDVILDNNRDLLSKEIEEQLQKTGEQIKVMEDKYHADISKLVQIIRSARDTGEWLTDVEFETISAENVFDEEEKENSKET